jgi:hypothetical protein
VQRQQHAGAVTGAGVGRDRAAVAQALEPVQGVIDHGAAPAALQVGHEADAARVALVSPGVVQGTTPPEGGVTRHKTVAHHVASDRILRADAGGRDD